MTFLGTGTSQGIPVIGCHCPVCLSTDARDQRLRASVLVEAEGIVFCIDSGPDFRQQMLRARVTRLDAVLYTHAHKDHLAGMDDVRAFNHLTGNPMKLFATRQVQQAIRQEFAYVFDRKNTYPGIPKVTFCTIGKDPFFIGPLRVIPIRVAHAGMPVLGFRIGNFTYITDANYIAPKQMEKIRGSTVLVLNALRKERHVSHFSLSEAIALAQALGVPTTYLTHISHQMGLHAEVEAHLPVGIALAYDGLIVHTNV